MLPFIHTYSALLAPLPNLDCGGTKARLWHENILSVDAITLAEIVESHTCYFTTIVKTLARGIASP
jgi:hypothetical protein